MTFRGFHVVRNGDNEDRAVLLLDEVRLLDVNDLEKEIGDILVSNEGFTNGVEWRHRHLGSRSFAHASLTYKNGSFARTEYFRTVLAEPQAIADETQVRYHGGLSLSKQYERTPRLLLFATPIVGVLSLDDLRGSHHRMAFSLVRCVENAQNAYRLNSPRGLSDGSMAVAGVFTVPFAESIAQRLGYPLDR